MTPMDSAAVRSSDETRPDEGGSGASLRLAGDRIDHEAAAAVGADAEREASARQRPERARDNVELPTHWWYRLGVWLEKKLSNLSVRNHFWHRLTSWIWMPLAYRSGIRVHKGSVGTFSALLPFRRFNRNWYKAMAGGALLANSELAGGMFIFQKCSGDWTVVCKELTYKFLRPCFGPAVYNMDPHENLDELVAAGKEFNLTLDIEVVQMVTSRLERERRVGVCTATFHVTPKSQHRKRKHWQKIQKRQKELEARDAEQA